MATLVCPDVDSYCTRRVNVSFDSATLEVIDSCAAELDTTRSHLLRTCFRFWLAHYVALHPDFLARVGDCLG